MKITTKTNLSAVAISAVFALVSCGDKTEVSTGETSATSSIESFIVSTAPTSAISITEARQSVEIGKEITLKGKVMGRMDPFVEGRALVTLGDSTKITSCDLRSGDGCPTPWDVCCDDHDVITASIATIQVTDSDGKPLKEGLKGVKGIKELSNLVVTGTIAEGSNADNFLVNATSIFVAE